MIVYANGWLETLALQRKPPKRGEKPIEHRRPLGRLRLYLDDLDDVHKLLMERTEGVSITAGNAVADVPDDLRDATRRELGQVRFVTNDPDVVVALTSSSAIARTSDDSPEAIEIIDDVQALLEPRRNNVYHFLRWTLITTLVLVAIPVLFLSIIIGILVAANGWNATLDRITEGDWAPSTLFLLGAAIAMAILGYFGNATQAKVIPERRGAARRFTAQTRQAWLVGISVVVLTVVTTALITYAFTR